MQPQHPDRPSDLVLRAWNHGCDIGWWTRNRGSMNSHNLIQFQYKLDHVDNNWRPCIDSLAGRAGDRPRAIACNEGDYQIWEVFHNGNGTITLKSKGAFTLQGRHLCLAAEVRPGGTHLDDTVLRTCDANSSWQQWL